MHDQAAAIALDAENKALFAARSPDTPDNFTRCVQPTVDACTAAGEVSRVRWKRRVAFYCPTGNYLAHVRNLDTLLRGLKKIDAPIDPVVITHSEPDKRFADMDAPIYFIPEPPAVAWQSTQRLGIKLNLDAFVHVSAVQGMAYAASIRCARKHIWWSHKWHGLTVPGIDGYIDATGGRQGKPWSHHYTALPDMFDGSKTAEAEGLRALYGGKTIYGTLCREEKITEEYVDTVAEILAKSGPSVFLYTGRARVPELDRVPDTAWIGWVDTSLWAQVIDVFLDTWPFGSGHTAWEAIAARKHFVSMESDDHAEQCFVHGMMKKHAARHVAAVSPADYVELALSMASGKIDARDDYYRFYQDHMRNEERMAREFTAILLGITDAREF